MLKGKDNNSKEKPSKPFWGPPISSATTTRQPFKQQPVRTIPSRAEEDFSVHHTSTVSNVWELTTPGNCLVLYYRLLNSLITCNKDKPPKRLCFTTQMYNMF